MAGQAATRKNVFSKKIDSFFTGLADAWRFVRRFFQEVFLGQQL
jgi:phospholipid/cholesterol/gamma-HCH transport system permease protein